MQLTRRHFALPLALAATLALLAPPPLRADTLKTISVTATYRERMALPAGSTLEIALLDVSRADAKADAISSVTVNDPHVPVRVTLHYHPSQIEAAHRYALRAKIVHGTTLLFTTVDTYPVLTHGAAASANLLLRRASATTPAHPHGSWRLVELDGATMPSTERPPTLDFISNASVAGFAGCNRMSGRYTADGQRLTFSPFAVTRMACIGDGMARESAYLKMLGTARTYRIGATLDLFDEHGTRIARFAPDTEK